MPIVAVGARWAALPALAVAAAGACKIIAVSRSSATASVSATFRTAGRGSSLPLCDHRHRYRERVDVACASSTCLLLHVADELEQLELLPGAERASASASLFSSAASSEAPSGAPAATSVALRQSPGSGRPGAGPHMSSARCRGRAPPRPRARAAPDRWAARRAATAARRPSMFIQWRILKSRSATVSQ